MSGKELAVFKGRIARALQVLAFSGALVVPLVASSPASATITPTRDAGALAATLDAPGITSAAFEEIPPVGAEEPNAVSTTPLAGFPTQGPSYLIMTTGAAAYADDPNAEGNKTFDHVSGPVRGNAADASVLGIDLTAPDAAGSCLSFDFRFFSEEFPEFIGSSFGDTFLAELGMSDWTVSGNDVGAPRNFVVDPNGDFISINSGFGMSEANAAGTTYDGGTPRLHVQAPTSGTALSLFLSIFDLGDAMYDSAVFLDNLEVTPGTCGRTTEPLDPPDVPPETTITSGPAEGSATNDRTPTFAFSADDSPSTFQCRLFLAAVTPPAFAVCSGPGDTHTPPAALVPGSWSFEVRAIDAAGNVETTPAKSTFRVDTAVRAAKLKAKKRQKQKRKTAVKLGASASEAVDVLARGKIKIKGQRKKLNLKRKRASIEAGKPAALKLGAKKKISKKIRRALKQGKKVNAALAVAFTDEAGNRVVKRKSVRLT